jgi:uncharacterized protein YkwD
VSRSISCPRCKQPLELPHEQLGRWVTCPECQMQFAALATAPPAQRYFAPSELSGRRTSPWILFGWLFTGLMACGALALIFVAANHTDSAPTTKAEKKAAGPLAQLPSPEPRLNPPREKSQPKKELQPSVPERQKPNAVDPPEPTAKNDPPSDRLAPDPPSDPPPTQKPKASPADTAPARQRRGTQLSLSPVDLAVQNTLNLYRKTAGLTPVTIDSALSEGCGAHARYLIENHGHPSIGGLGAHKEESQLGGYTEKGAISGERSVIVQQEGQPRQLWQAGAIDLWMGTLYHRVPLLNPNLRKVGLGYAASRDYHHRVIVLDVLSDALENPVSHTQKNRVVILPVDKQKNVPCLFNFGNNETPNPIPDNRDARDAGYPLTVTFYDEPQIEDVEVTIKGFQGKQVPAWVSTPNHLTNPACKQPGTIAAITRGPMRRGTTYLITVSAKVDGVPWNRSWKFTTGLQ